LHHPRIQVHDPQAAAHPAGHLDLVRLHRRLSRRDGRRLPADHEAGRGDRVRHLVQLRLQPAARHAGGRPPRRHAAGGQARATARTAGRDRGERRRDLAAHGGPHRKGPGRRPLPEGSERALRADGEQPGGELPRPSEARGFAGRRAYRCRPAAFAARRGGHGLMGTKRAAAVIALALAVLPAARPQAAPLELASPPGMLARLIAEGRELVGRGEAEAAYAALSAQPGLYAGDPEFDYLLGIAALDTGRYGEAILPFERVLLVQPDHLQARAELGRAYLAAGEYENARAAFRDVASRDIPPEARRLVGRYLDELARLEARHRIAITGLVGLEVGYDTNANVGSSSDEWILGNGTPAVPLPVSLPERSMRSEERRV